MSHIILFATRAVSCLIGYLAHFKPTHGVNQFILKSFIKSYNVNVEEIEAPVSTFESIGEFFVRTLKRDARPIADKANRSICSPVDGVLRTSGTVDADVPVLVKKQQFNWGKFLVDPALENEFRGGTFFNFYLSPKDYHNVHFPFSGRVVEIIHHPGGLLPVNDWSITRFPNLFCFNERLVAVIQGEQFKYLVVMIGALNVGSIELAFDPEFRRGFFALKTFYKYYREGKNFITGDRFGSFKLGSSVVCVFPKGVAVELTNGENSQVNFGSKLAAANMK